MKIKYTLLAFTVFFVLSQFAFAQWSTKYIDANNCYAPVNADGYFFNNTSQINGFQAPFGTGKIAIYASNLWMGGLDQNGFLHIAAQTYQQHGTDYWPGPLRSDGTPYPAIEWDKIWSINRSTIDNHIANYNQTSYTLPSTILEWPGSGYNGVTQVFAPYVDLNNNNLYDPTYGDYPNVKGDKALYLMYNDKFGSHGETGGVPLGVEIYTTVYAYNPVGFGALNNTVFVRHRIRNKSQNTYHNLLIGIWNDFDIGDNGDDYIGTDVPRNMVYGFNADSLDGDGMGITYGNHPPYVGMKFLNHQLTSGMYYTNTSSPAIGNPVSEGDYYNYLQAKWKDGTDLNFGGNGYQTGQGVARYAFSNGTDPNFSTNWTIPSQADFRIIGNTGTFDLAPNGYLTIDLAYIFAQPYNNEGIIVLNNYADEVQTFYNEIINSDPEIAANKLNVICFPNPCNDQLTIMINEKQVAKNNVIKIFDIEGSEISSFNAQQMEKININTSKLSKGIYYLELTNNLGSYNAKFIKN